MSDFMLRAVITGIMVAVMAALVGVPIVLKKNSMLPDGLSHVGFGVFAIAAVMGLLPLYVALPVVILVSFLILRLGKSSKINGDAAIAVMSVSSLAIGTFVVSLAGTDVDIDHFLFGSILSVGVGDMVMAAVTFVITLAFYAIFYNKIFATVFDEKFAKAVGIKVDIFNMVFAVLCSVVVVLGMRVMGALLISALIVFPTLISRVIFKNFKGVVIFSAVISAICLALGVLFSYLLAAPTGATIVIVELVTYLVTLMFGKIFR